MSDGGGDVSSELKALLQNIEQGDTYLSSELVAVYFAHNKLPLTNASRQLLPEDFTSTGFAVVTSTIEGAVIVSQTCDIIKEVRDHPFVLIAAARAIMPEEFSSAQKGSNAQFIFLPGLSEHRIVADLDLIWTIEKTVLLEWNSYSPVKPLRTDQERTTFADAAGRKFNRVAFPDEFNESIKKISDWIKGKAGKNSDEGRFVDAIDEIRVTTVNDWASPNPEPTLLFFTSNTLDEKIVEKHIAAVKKKHVAVGQFVSCPEIRIVNYAMVSAQLYRESHPLDFNYLSKSSS